MPHVCPSLPLIVASCMMLAGPARALAVGDDLSLPGPHFAGRQSVTVTRADNSTFTAQLYYPATSTGASTPYDSTAAPYPAISFGHGFLQSVAQYRSTLEHLATHGYFVIASESQGGLFPSHGAFASDLSRCLTWLEQQHALPASFLHQQVITGSFGMSGHSMGGGASLLAAAADTRVKVVANLAAAETNPSAIAACASITAPTYLISGSQDSIVPPRQHGQPMYAALAGPRQLPLLAGAFHCGFEDSSGFGCDSGAMPRATQLAITRALLTRAFNLHLKGDQSHWREVWGPEAPAQAQTTLQASPRFALEAPAGAIVADTAGVATALLTLTNLSTVTQTFALEAEDNLWPATFVPTATPPIPPGGSCPITLQVSTTPARGSDTMLLSARSVDDGGTRAWTIVTIERRAECAADLAPAPTGDNTVNVQDLLAVIGAWGPCENPNACPTDIAPIGPPLGDDVVNVQDLLAVIGAWGACP